MQTPDTLDKELVASVVDVENGGNDGGALPYHAFQKAPALAKKKKIVTGETMSNNLNQAKKWKDMARTAK